MDRVATNIMMARYPLHLTKVGEAWKWDMFGGLTPDICDERMAVLGRKTKLLESLAGQIHDGIATNVTEILQAVQNGAP